MTSRFATTVLSLSLLGAGVGSASAGEGRDFAPEAQLIYRLAACAKDGPLPDGLDPKLEPIVQKHCRILGRWYGSYRKTYIDQAMPFLAELRTGAMTEKVVYPFGGGDLISALTTYPDASEYTTMSLEHAGDPRRVRDITAKALGASLERVRSAIAGLILQNDSKTENMMKVQRGELPGQLTFFLAALAVHGYEPRSVRYFRLESDGTVHYLSEDDIAAVERQNARLLSKVWVSPDFSEAFSNVEIGFAKAGAGPDVPLKVHRHFAADLGDPALTKDGRLLAHLKQKGRVVAMTKAASYLLWRDSFSMIRDYLLENVELMISDSTGVPPKLAQKAGFQLETYGRFESSFLGASPAINSEFRALWKSQPSRNLPFRYGYLDGAKHFHLMVMRKLKL